MNLADILNGEFSQSQSQDIPPTYLSAADNHNLVSTRGGSWFDPSTWEDKFAGFGKLIATGMLSGANSFYNTGAVIGNFFGLDTRQRDTDAWISSVDSDWGRYYEENKGAADLLGFVAGSLIPGIAGVKLFNAGQKVLVAASARGLLGTNLSRATGLLVPTTERYIAASATKIAQAGATFSSINVNTVKALSSGVWQNVLEGAAFETAIQATMFKSPILDEQSSTDIVKNIAISGLVGGAIGGAFEAAKSLGKIKSTVASIESEIKPSSARFMPAEAFSPSSKIVLLSQDRDLAATSLLAPENSNFFASQKALADKYRRIDNEIRSQAHHLIPGSDLELGNMIADSIYGLPSKTILDSLLDVDQVARLNVRTKVEDAIRVAIKAKEPVPPNLIVQYVKLIGENAGIVSSSAPVAPRIADFTSGGRDAVLSVVKEHKFRLDKLWDSFDLSGKLAYREAEARQIYASLINPKDLAGRVVHMRDIPLLEAAYNHGILDIKLTDGTGQTIKTGFANKEELWNHIRNVKLDTINEFSSRALYKKLDTPEANAQIARIANIKSELMDSPTDELISNQRSWLASQAEQEDWLKWLESKGLKGSQYSEQDIRFLPSWAKVTRNVQTVTDVDGNVLDGITRLKAQQRLHEETLRRVAAKGIGELYDLVPEITDSQLMQSNRYGAGASFWGFANGSYGSLESALQQSGAVANKLKQSLKETTTTQLTSPLSALGNNLQAAIEFQTINQKVTRSGQLWIKHTLGDDEAYLVTKRAFKAFAKDGELDFDSVFATFPEDIIKIHLKETRDFIDSHIARTGERTVLHKELNAAYGRGDTKDPAIFRPIRPSPTDYPYIAFVVDPTVTDVGHKTMIFASSEQKLQELIDKLPAKFKAVTKRDAEDFHRAWNDYEYSRTLHESYIDSSLANKGIYSEFYTKTDPQKIVNEILQQHLREDDVLATELVRAKNSYAYDFLEDQGNAYTKIAASKLGSISERMLRAEGNPYLSYIKTGLDIPRQTEYPLLFSINRSLDTAVSRAWGAVKELGAVARTPEEMEKINDLLTRYGIDTGYRDAATDLLVNHTAPKGVLTKFVRSANAVLAKLTLGLDPLNALNNAIGANILRTTELKQITDAIASGDSAIAGKLAALTQVDLPNGVGSITSPGRLISNSIRNWFNSDLKSDLMQTYKKAGWVSDITQQFRSITDDLALQGTESVNLIHSKLQSAFKKAKDLTTVGETYSGNKLAEEFNRFISADVMRQLTDVAVDAKLLTKAEQAAYINTFVNRVEGNLVASQRPLIFQGPIGQSIGLFQSYQFNLLQQMFRYVAEGTKKDAAMLLGLQSTFYGLQGLPAFQFINQHVVGTLSGNKNHTDLYDATYGIFGQKFADLLMYGIPSNLVQANIYSRGDINPRHLTVIPTSLPEIPFIGAYGKFLDSVKTTVEKIAVGANVWESMLQGLEHNGLSRPLAGLAQVLQSTGPDGTVFSTTTKGSILWQNDLMSWASAVRLTGGRPLDEAIVNDGLFRIQAYKAYDREKNLLLANAIKTSSTNGQIPDEHQVAQFAAQYAKNGGKQANFNSFMLNEIKIANQTQAEKIMMQLHNPFTQKMQLLMGGSTID